MCLCREGLQQPVWAAANRTVTVQTVLRDPTRTEALRQVPGRCGKKSERVCVCLVPGSVDSFVPSYPFQWRLVWRNKWDEVCVCVFVGRGREVGVSRTCVSFFLEMLLSSFYRRKGGKCVWVDERRETCVFLFLFPHQNQVSWRRGWGKWVRKQQQMSEGSRNFCTNQRFLNLLFPAVSNSN